MATYGTSFSRKWKPLFFDFCSRMRIDSKEVAATDERGVALDLWGSQKLVVNEIFAGLDEDQRIFDILKGRQAGISTVTLALDMFWLALHPGITAALVTDTEENRDKFRAILRRYIENLPEELIGEDFRLLKDNKTYMAFGPGGQRLDFLVAGKTKAAWGDSQGYTMAHLTECALYGNPSGLASFRETLAEQHPNRLFIYESRANGPNHWKEMCEEAQRDTTSKRFIFVPWWSKELNSIPTHDPKYKIYGVDAPDAKEREKIDASYERYGFVVSRNQLAWKRWRDSDTSISDADKQQNQPWLPEDAFVFTGYSFFQTRLLTQDINSCTEPDNEMLYRWKGYRYLIGNDFFSVKMEQITDQERIDEVELRVWDEPVKDGQYTIGCDPAFGRNDWKDRHAIGVFRCYADRLVQVAEFATSEVEAHHCAWVLAHLAGAYRNCIVNLDMAGGPGRAVMREWENLRNQMRADMYAQQRREMQWDDPLAQARWYLYHRPDALGAGYCYNFMTARDSKFDLMNRMRTSYTTRLMWIRSRKMLEEMQVVIQDGSNIGAPGREKDDRTFAGALANFAWDEWIRPPMMTEGLSYEVVNMREKGEESITNRAVDRLVHRFFQNAEEKANDPYANVPKYMRERGLA